jgi:hypothetical protein
MAIVQSRLVEDRAQVDGRRQVWEQHVDQLGVAHDVFYMAEKGDDAVATMQARVPLVEAQLAAEELAANLAEVLA